jgi:hypothetical protein
MQRRGPVRDYESPALTVELQALLCLILLHMPVGADLIQSSRRTFLKGVAGVSALFIDGFEDARAIGVDAFGGDESRRGMETPGWYDRPMRWAQLSFVEDDPGNYDLGFWLDYFKLIHADAALLDAGGCVAFYPTRVPFHHRSKWLRDMDTFGEIAAACRKLGMNLVARTDAHACHQDVHDAHPDWLMMDEHGNKVRHPSDKDFWLTCALGPYNFEFMTAVHKEIMTMYKPDAIFTNRWAGSGMCYCEHCRQNFHQFSGLDLPRTLDPRDPARRQFLVWHQQRLFELCRVWNAAIQQINPGACYLANAGGGALSELDMKTFGGLAPAAIADRQSRRGLMAPWMAGRSAKEYRSTMDMKPVVGLTSVGIDDKNRWKDSVQNADEIRPIDHQRFQPANGGVKRNRGQTARAAGQNRQGKHPLTLTGKAALQPCQKARVKPCQSFPIVQSRANLTGTTSQFKYRS